MPVRGRGIDLDTMTVSTASISSPVNITGTSSASPTTVLTAGPFSIENPGTFLVTVFTPQLTRGTTNLDLELKDGTTLLTTLSGHYTAAPPFVPFTFRVLITLAAGNHTLNVTGFVDAGTGVFGAGAGTTGNLPNAFITVQPA